MDNEAIQEQKKVLRREMLQRRRALPPESVQEKSAAILNQVAAMPEVVQAECILTYVASKDNEVDTKPFIATLLQEGRRVYVPKVVAEGAMQWCALHSLSELRPQRFGILEPPQCTEQLPTTMEESVCLVPGLAFTREGYRLGYGGGYFDRFLAGYYGFALGIAYACQLVERVPVAEHDVRLPCVVTEAGFQCCI